MSVLLAYCFAGFRLTTKLTRRGLRNGTRWVERLVRLVLGQSLRPSRLPSAKVLCRKIPINQFVENGGNVVRAAVLIVQVVGVFPHVDGQQRFQALGQRRIRIAGL